MTQPKFFHLPQYPLDSKPMKFVSRGRYIRILSVRETLAIREFSLSTRFKGFIRLRASTHFNKQFDTSHTEFRSFKQITDTKVSSVRLIGISLIAINGARERSSHVYVVSLSIERGMRSIMSKYICQGSANSASSFGSD